MIFKFYDRTVAEGRSFLIFAILFAVVIRFVDYFHSDIVIMTVAGEGYFWKPLAPFFSNPLYSLLGSSVMVALIAGSVHYVNIKHAFIRRRTLLPPAVAILLFSCIPSELAMSPYYIAALCMVLIVNALFEAHSFGYRQGSAYKVTFYLTLGSLFAPILLLYLPILWICLMRVRSFSFKSFLASIFSLLVLYIPVFSYFFLTENIEGFLKPFIKLSNIDWSILPVLQYSILQYVILGVLALLFLMILIDNSVNSFKDKIRVRVFSAVLTIIVLFSFLCTLLLNIDTETTLFTGLAVGALQIAHFFSLAQKKVTAVIFLVCFLTLIAVSLLPFS